ncbi:MDR family MFS transporter [Brevibacillus ginsengisoli]|uniref:MDR family MFS transporter n=1 Tax=Brevibacillus ginsengisoli TaxID=363854 RepID=UPI003CF86035
MKKRYVHLITPLLSRYNRVVWIRFLGEFLTGLTGSMLTPFLIFYLQAKLGGSVVLPMFIIGLQPFSEILVTLLGGNITDRIGRKPVILFALGLQASAILGFILADSVWVFALLYTLNGIGRSLFIPAQRAQITDVVGEHQRSEVFAVLSTVGYISATIGPLIGLLAYRYQPVSLFFCEAFALVIYALVFWRFVPESVSLHHTESQKQIACTAQERKPLVAALQDYRLILGLMIFSLPISFFYAQSETTLSLYLKNSFSNYLTIVASLTTIKAILAIVLGIFLVKVTQHLSTARIMMVAYSCFTITALIYGTASSFSLLVVAQLMVVIGESIGLNRLIQLVSILAPADQRGRYFSIYGTHWDISRSIGPVLGGYMLVGYGGELLFLLVAVLLVVGGICQTLLTRRLTSQALEAKGTS